MERKGRDRECIIERRQREERNGGSVLSKWMSDDGCDEFGV